MVVSFLAKILIAYSPYLERWISNNISIDNGAYIKDINLQKTVCMHVKDINKSGFAFQSVFKIFTVFISISSLQMMKFHFNGIC